MTAEICRHETFKDICAICHSNNVIDKQAAEIERLREEARLQYQDGHHDGYEEGCSLKREVVERYDRLDAELATLRAKNERLRAALRAIADPKQTPSDGDPQVLRDYANAQLTQKDATDE